MGDLELKKLQQCATREVMERLSDANRATMAIRVGELDSLHVSAYMNIEKTTQSLNKILAYKKQLAIALLQCSDEKQLERNALKDAIKHSDSMICQVLGLNV